MQFQKLFKEGIRAGTITCSFRKWRSPQAKVGGQYNLHPVGAIEVTSVRLVTFSTVTDSDARYSGFADRSALARYLKAEDNDDVFGWTCVRQQKRQATTQIEAVRQRASAHA